MEQGITHIYVWQVRGVYCMLYCQTVVSSSEAAGIIWALINYADYQAPLEVCTESEVLTVFPGRWLLHPSQRNTTWDQVTLEAGLSTFDLTQACGLIAIDSI